MVNLEIILIAVIWVSYGVFNTWQHDWYRDNTRSNPLQHPWFWGRNSASDLSIFNILLSPIALLIRLFRGIFYWKGTYK